MAGEDEKLQSPEQCDGVLKNNENQSLLDMRAKSDIL